MIPTEPGIYRELAFEDYGSIRALSPSRVKSCGVSMKQFAYDRSHPKQATKAMLFGSAIHCAVLEPDEFMKRYVLWDGGRRGTNVHKAFMAANTGKIDLTPTEYDTCLAARDSAHAHPIAGPILKAEADRELSVVWRDHDTDLMCKGRPDLFSSELGLYDLKTTTARVSDSRRLTYIATDFGYHISLGAYQVGLIENGYDYMPVRIIFVEQNPPHDVVVRRVQDADLATGQDLWGKWLEQIAGCRKSGIWPGYDDTESDLHIWTAAAQVEVDYSGI